MTVDTFWSFSAVCFWTLIVMGITSLLINYGIRKRLQARLFLPKYTAQLMADCFMMDSDEKWAELEEMGIGIKFND